MEKLWAPWRMSYITAPRQDDCFLCRAWREEDHEGNLVLWKGRETFVVMNKYPYNNGHLMVACAAHEGDLAALAETSRAELMETTNKSINCLKAALAPHAFNVGMNVGIAAGAGLAEHLHLHIVPRWNGDTNFMPLLADVKVISEHLNETYRKLKEYFG